LRISLFHFDSIVSDYNLKIITITVKTMADKVYHVGVLGLREGRSLITSLNKAIPPVVGDADLYEPTFRAPGNCMKSHTTQPHTIQ
jgi:hypothetical protein